MDSQKNDKKVNSPRQRRSPQSRSEQWNMHWQYLHPNVVQELLAWVEDASNSDALVKLREEACVLSSIEACLELPQGELTTPGFEMWVFLWHLSHKLSELYPASESKGRFNAQGLEFLIRVEGESLLTVLLAARHLEQWRYAISLRISSGELQKRLHEAGMDDVLQKRHINECLEKE
jgi:hypothetical protein